jgi:NAD(P)-dependent dehydrogenase (short-subunit alcohol dehydrogenase family)
VYAGQFMPEWPDLGALARRIPPPGVPALNVGDQASVQAVAGTVAASVAHVDLLINNAGISARGPAFGEGIDYQSMLQAFSVNSVGPLRMVEAFLPLLDAGDTKRICFVSPKRAARPWCTAKTALATACRKRRSTVASRTCSMSCGGGLYLSLYHTGWMRTYMGRAKSTHCNLSPRNRRLLPCRFRGRAEDEDRLVMIDYMGYEWPF